MTTSALRTSQTVGQLVAERPERGRVFERLGIDYCCGGRKPLAAVCDERGLDVQHVVAQLNAADATPPANTEPDWTTVPLSQLADHVESAHHALMRRELPRVAALVHKVAGVHGGAHPELKELEQTFVRFANELATHMSKEESALFPWIRALERSAAQNARPGSALDEPVRMMMREHDDAGRALTSMRELTNGFAPPENACGTYRVMLASLRDIETDMHTHVHKENNILFPRAIALEACNQATAGGRACCTKSW
jgi:regulator of cell morphogenesis and NO signaling